MTRPRIGVVLSGCGVYDGSEIHEAVLTLLALDRAGAQAVCLAPDIPQRHVVNHATGLVVEGEERNVLVESARIARGAVADVANADPSAMAALILVGGFGAAKNLSSFAFDGAACSVDPGVTKLVRAVYAAGKPIGAMCIAPVVLARLLGSERPVVTIGTDAGTAAQVEAMGAEHRNCQVDSVVVDPDGRLVTTPAYMLAGSISEAATGIERLVGDVVRMAQG
jgi:enhancing lycopene biosynthesis protein 2